MSVREYIGARYVPLFASPLEWDQTKTYEPLTIVLYQGNSFTSRQYVPAGIGIDNTAYWAQTGNYNAQVEQYRAEVETYDNRITENATDIGDLESALPKSNFDSTNTVKKYVDDADTAIEALLPATSFDSTNTVKKYVDAADTAIEALLPATSFDSTNTVKKYVDDAITDIGALLPSTAFDSTDTVKKYVDDSIAAYDSRLTELVIFGDSWSDASVTDSIYGALVGAKLGLTVHNYAQNGAHYTSSSSNLLVQLAAFNADTSYDKSKIAFFVMTYGVNDQWTYSTSAANSQSHVLQLVEGVASAAPNAPFFHLINFTYAFANNRMRTQWPFIYNAYLTLNTNKNYHPIWLAKYFTIDDMNPSNYFHLTQNGQRRLAEYVCAWATGGAVTIRPQWSIDIQQFTNIYIKYGIQILDDCVEHRIIAYTSGAVSNVGETLLTLNHPMIDCYAKDVPLFFNISSLTDGFLYFTPIASAASGQVGEVLNNVKVAAYLTGLLPNKIYGFTFKDMFGSYQTFS